MRVSDERCALVSPTTRVAVTRSPGSLPDSSDASFTVNGIVIAGMKPLMSSCLIKTSLRAGSMPTNLPAAARTAWRAAHGWHAASSATTTRETIRRPASVFTVARLRASRYGEAGSACSRYGGQGRYHVVI